MLESETPEEEEIQRQIILYILQENLNQLAILKYINGWAEETPFELEYKSIESKYGGEPDVISKQAENELNLEDFRKDCAFLESVLTKTFNEIAEYGTYHELLDIINIFNDTSRDEDNLITDKNNKDKDFEELKRQASTEEQLYCRDINECTAEIGRLKDDIEDFMAESSMKLKYVEQWQNSKEEMNTIKLNTEEETKIKMIKTKQHQCRIETRVHKEMEKIFNEIELEYDGEIAYWQNKYKTDLGELNAKIQILSDKRTKQLESTNKLQEMYKKRQREIDEFTEYKLKQEEKRKEQERRDRAATLIEAWWRGVMVRKGFGKFRKRKDRKGKKKGSTDKKTK